MQHKNRPFTRTTLATTILAGALTAATALAGGTPENILLIINPADADSLYLGNYYKHARNIPDANVLYMNPGATNFAEFAGPNGNIDAVLGYLKNTGLEQTVHYIVIAPTNQFFISASGYITDSCWPVARFAMPSAYSLSFSRQQILSGGIPSTLSNGYFSTNTTTFHAFDNTVSWLGGAAHPSGRRLYMGALLGYTGTRGNTVTEIREMIDRSVAVDGTRPAGTFYFMNTTDQDRNIRATTFPGVVNVLTGAGGSGQIINGVLPIGHHNVRGVVTGWASPDIDGADMTILPGAFADHVTSWAATFDNGSQTKLSAWIRRGVSGSSGTVEEPCAYPGKFPHSLLHYFSFRGMSLGEAWLRSLAYLPFQQIFVGDPLTRPHAYIPSVQHNLPAGIVGGQVALAPAASTQAPAASIATLDLLANGVRIQSQPSGSQFTLDTTRLPDGYSEVRFIAYENTPLKSAGSAGGMLRINNHGRTATLSTGAASGNLTTRFEFSASASGGTVSELRLLHNGRVVVAAAAAPATLHIYGRNLGAGQSHVQLEAIFADGRRALSERLALDVSTSAGALSGHAPVACSYTKHVLRGQPFVVELPGSFDDALAGASFQIISPPGQAIVGTTAGTGPYRIMTSPANAWGPDSFTYRITTPSGQSSIGTVTLVHGKGESCYANCDGSTTAPVLNVDDFTCFINAFAASSSLPHAQQVVHYANCDRSTTAPVLNVDDFTCFINRFAEGCL